VKEEKLILDLQRERSQCSIGKRTTVRVRSTESLMSSLRRSSENDGRTRHVTCLRRRLLRRLLLLLLREFRVAPIEFGRLK
jgi:hypothetical protein